MIASRKKRIALFVVNSAIRMLSLPGRLFSEKKHPSSIEPKKILLVRLDHIGDVIMTSPAFSAIRTRFPEAKIILLANSAAGTLFKDDERIDEIIVLNWPWMNQEKHSKFSKSKITEVFKIMQKLRQQKIDLFVDFRGDLRFVILFGLFAGIQNRIGNSRSGNSGLLLHQSVYNLSSHETERSMDVITCLNASVENIRPSICLPDFEIAAIKDFIKSETGSSHTHPLAIIAPYSAQDIKSWPIDYFRDVINHLLNKGFTTIVIGTKEDSESATEMVKPFPQNVFSLAGKTTLRQVAALFSISNLAIGIDTGALHLASCFDIPIVAIFGPTRPVEFRPYSPFSKVLDCESCQCNQFLHLKCDYLVNGYSKCLHKLAPARVIEEIDNLVAKRSRFVP